MTPPRKLIESKGTMFIILASNSSRKVVAHGTPKEGRPFSSEAAAERHLNVLKNEFPNIDFLILPITAWEG